MILPPPPPPLQLAEVSDTERNFAFKVTSPVRVLLLQAEGSLEVQEWLDVLNNAIAHAIHGGGGSDGGVDGRSAPGHEGRDNPKQRAANGSSVKTGTSSGTGPNQSEQLPMYVVSKQSKLL